MPARATRSSLLEPLIADYVADHSTPPDTHQVELIERTAELGWASAMQIGTEQGVLLEMLIRSLGAIRVVEIGTFTGYSSVCLARGLDPGGKLHCFDISDEWTQIARATWEATGLSDRIELHLGNAIELLGEIGDEALDAVFIDADKSSYQSYVDHVAPMLRPGGLLLIDNTLWSGKVAALAIDDSPDDRDTPALRALNDALVADPRFIVSLVPIGDGLTIAQKL